ncbi:MAG TPA: IS1634 family transposase [Actinomycetes bacterium]|nr:IS1634 family transposase [Actinomycetes bacterium]
MAVMYITRVPNRDSPPAVLLRESYREGGKVKNRTVANLSSWPEAKVEALARALKGLPPAGLDGTFEVARSLPHGHVAAVLGTMRGLGLEELIDSEPSRQRGLVAAMITAAVIGGSSKLATARGLQAETAASSLGEVLGLGPCDEDDLYAAMDWLLPRQQAIEGALAARHLSGGTLVLYDVSSAAFEGRTCPLGEIGHARDGVRGRLQIVYGVLTTTDGVPVAVEVFKGSTGDPSTLASQVTKLKQRFGLAHVAVVGDRGMLTKARIREDLKPAELDWVTALRGPAIAALVTEGAIQPTLFDQTDMAEITSPDYPGERLIACYNPFLEAERARKRGELLAATEAELEKVAAATRRMRRPLRGKGDIALAVGKVINKKKVAKHFIIEVTEESLSWRRDEGKIAAEAALDGIYVIRTSLPTDLLGTGAAVESYKALENVERVFRGLNTDLLIRPIRHRLEDRVRAHVLIRTLAYYITWHMQQRLAPMLFKDDDPAAGKAARPSPVAPARRSPPALAKTATKTAAGGPAHSFATLLADLATITANRIQPTGGLPAFTVITTPTPIQRQAFELLGVTHRLGHA